VVARPAAPEERTDWRPLRTVGWVTGAVGLCAVAGTTIAYAASKDLTQPRFDTLRLVNDLGWAATGAGAVMVLTSYVFGRAPDDRVAAVGIGPGSISVSGRF
jgi:hypothetical protein